MTVVYLLITLSPFASAALHSKSFFNSVSRECSGDCRKCGCSAEKSASRSCCCWQKKQAVAKKEQPADKSCPTGSSIPSRANHGCCNNAPGNDDNHDDLAVVEPDIELQQDIPTISISTCPCGDGKDLAFPGSGNGQHMPFCYTSYIPEREFTPITSFHNGRLDTRYSEPPDPPPKLLFNS